MQPIESKVINRVHGCGRGWAFVKNDFLDLGLMQLAEGGIVETFKVLGFDLVCQWPCNR